MNLNLDQPTIDIDGTLSKRLILAAAIAAGVYPAPLYLNGRNLRGWNIPLRDPFSGEIVGYFWKNADSSDSPKYFPRGQDGTGYKLAGQPGEEWFIYDIEATQHTILDANGVVYIANGIPGLLAMRSAGVANAIAGRAETYPPKNLIAVLRQYQVSVVRFMVDNDVAGYQAAMRWREALRGSGIDFQPLTWGYRQVDRVEVDKYGNETAYIICEDIPPKADANDIWIMLKGNKTAFQQRLQSLPALDLPTPPEKTDIPLDTSRFDETPQGLIQAILAAAEERGFKGHGNWLNGLSLFRDEQKPSFGINKQTGVGHDFNGDTYGHREVAEALGIDWKAYYPKLEKPQTQPRSAASPQQMTFPTSGTAALQPETAIHAHAALFPGGLPNSWRSNLLEYAPSGSAALFEIVNESIQRGLLNPDDFTRADLQQAAVACGQSLSDSMLSRLLKENSQESLVGILFSEFHPVTEKDPTGGKSENKVEDKRIRHYQLRDRATIHEELLIRFQRRIYEDCNPVEPVAGEEPIIPYVTPGMTAVADVEDTETIATTMNDALATVHRLQDHAEQKALRRARRTFEQVKRDMEKEYSTPLPADWPHGNDIEFRAAYAHALVRENPGLRRSKSWWGRTLGMDKRSIGNVLARAGVVGTKQYEYVPLRPDEPVEAQVELGRRQVYGFPRFIVTLDELGDLKHEMGYAPEAAQRLLKRGERVTIKYQVANSYDIASEQVPERKVRECKPKVTAPDTAPEKPQEKAPLPMPRSRRYFGKGYDPLWLYRHFVRMLEYTTDFRVRNDRVYDVLTGEIILEAPTLKELIDLILGRWSPPPQAE